MYDISEEEPVYIYVCRKCKWVAIAGDSTEHKWEDWKEQIIEASHNSRFQTGYGHKLHFDKNHWTDTDMSFADVDGWPVDRNNEPLSAASSAVRNDSWIANKQAEKYHATFVRGKLTRMDTEKRNVRTRSSILQSVWETYSSYEERI